MIDDYSFTCKFHAPHWLFFDIMGPISGGYIYTSRGRALSEDAASQVQPDVKDYALLQQKFPTDSGMVYLNPDLPC